MTALDQRAGGMAEHTASPNLAGTVPLVRFMLRRDRVKLPVWVGGLGAFVVYVAAALPVIAPTDEELRAATTLFNDPVGRMLTGPGYGMSEPTYERFFVAGYGLYFLILVALMNIFLIARHTRVEEQTGRAELVRASIVGRHAALAAAWIVALITNVAAMVVVATLMVTVGGFGPTGSVLFGGGLVAAGLAFAGLTTVTVQLSAYSRAASGMAGGLLGLAFVARVGGDMAQEGGSALSWLSPLAWVQQSAPFVLDRWWPLALPLALAAVSGVAGVVLSSRRDLGAGLLSARPGPAAASGRLGTPLGLAARLQRGLFLGWGLGLLLGGVIFGAYADSLLGAADDLPAAILEVFGADDMLAGYLDYCATMLALLTAAYGVMAVLGVRSEESSGRADTVLATPVSRSAWLGSHVAVICGGATALMVASGVFTGLGAAIVTGEASYVGSMTGAHVNLLPAVLVVIAVAVLMFGLAPRLLATVAWLVVGFSAVVGTFGRMLDLPTGLTKLSPFEHPAAMPLEEFSAGPVALLLIVALAATVGGLVTLRRREIATR